MQQQFNLFDANSDYYEIGNESIDEAKLNFKVHASVIYKLGESLIADEVTALSELMKNAYDADASYCKLEIDPDYAEDNAHGRITISDNGCGMDLKTIVSGWLTISNSPKKKMKRNNETTKKYKRIPLGEKGLGRLSVQKLGRKVEMVTKQAGSNTEYSITIPWNSFLENTTIDQIHIPCQKKTVENTKSYTKIIITDLINPNYWKKEENVKGLEKTIGKIISPFKFKKNNFVISATVGNYTIDVSNAVFNDVLDTARCKYTFSVDSSSVTLTCSYKVDFFRRRRYERKYQLFDFSRDYFAEMYMHNSEMISGWTYHSQGDVVYEVKTTIKLDDYPDLLRDSATKKIFHPGVFEGQIYDFYFDKDYVTALISEHALTDAFNESEYSKYVKDNRGIKIIRDGFVVQGYSDGDIDWLNLSSGPTTTGKYGDLNNESIIGYILLSGEHNQSLKETTSREGFVNDEFYRNFYTLIKRIVIRQINLQNQKIVGIFASYLNELYPEDNANQDPIKQIESLSGKATELSRKLDKRVAETKKYVDTQLNKVREESKQASLFSDTTDASNNRYEEIISSQSQMIEQLQQELASYLAEVEQAERHISEVQQEIEMYRRKMSDVFELAGLGISVELFTHELYTTINNVNEKLVGISQEHGELMYIQNAMNSLRKQISYFHPGLKYVRLKKEDVSVKKLLQEHLAFYKAKCEQYGISGKVITAKDVRIRMNVGLFNQVLDNLFSNSFYWLLYSRDELNQIEDCEYNLEITPDGRLNVWDNGIGISTNIEQDIFNPFVSCKKDGRGLGLFICRNNLENNGSSIRLLRERNEFGNLYKFQINLSNIEIKE